MKVTHNLIFDTEQDATAFVERASIYPFRFDIKITFTQHGRVLVVNDRHYTSLVASNFMREESK